MNYLIIINEQGENNWVFNVKKDQTKILFGKIILNPETKKLELSIAFQSPFLNEDEVQEVLKKIWEKFYQEYPVFNGGISEW